MALFVAAVWYALIATCVTVADPPVFAEGEPFDRMLRRFVDWQVTTFVQERIDITIAMVAFLALIALGLSLREHLGRDRPLPAYASVAIALGSSLWIVGSVFELGGHRALELFARIGNDLGPFDAIQFTIAEIDDWFGLTGFALIGIGILTFSATAVHAGVLSRSWAACSLVVGGLFLPLSAAYVANNGDLVDLLLFAGGIVLLPLWGLWTARCFPGVKHDRKPRASLSRPDVILGWSRVRRSIVAGGLSFLILLTNAAASAGTPGPKFNPPKTYYLALGDSFSFGYQVTRVSTPPDPAAFDHGFVDDLGVYLRRIAPAITTINYGCPGESTVTFIEGGCPWTAQGFPLHDSFDGTQLDAAVGFLRAHPGEVSPITISLALNDVQRLIAECAFDPACIQQRAPATTQQITANLATILERLRRAAPNVEIIVLGPYDPFIGNLEFADPLFIALNGSMAETVAGASARYADIFPTFNPQGDIDAETRTLCMLTLWCTHGDGHPSDLGYQLMADTIFEASGYERLLDGET